MLKKKKYQDDPERSQLLDIKKQSIRKILKYN